MLAMYSLLRTTNINLRPVALMNNLGNNICWWNSFIQLFAATRNEFIVTDMIKYINEHSCRSDNNNNNNKKCWYCNNLKTTIEIMTENNNSYVTDFSKTLFIIPSPVVDLKDANKYNISSIS